MAYIGRQQDGFGVRSRFIYTATGGQTTFNTDDSGNALSYSDGAYVDVYLNGVLLDPADYTATSLTSIVLDSGATASDILEVIVYDVFSVFSGTFTNGITASEATVTGDLTISDKIVHSGDTNTSIRFPGTDRVTIETAGSERMRVNSTGVGIGTNSPVRQLHVNAASGNNAYVHLTNATTGATTTDGFSIVVTDSNGEAILIQREAQPLSFRTSGTERMRIDSSGNVGVGQSSPSTTLSVRGGSANGIELDEDLDNSTDSNRLFFTTSAGSNSIRSQSGNLVFSTGATAGSSSGTERMRIDSSGNLGIGQTSPTVKLDIDNGSFKVNRGNSAGDIAVFRGLNAEKFKIDTDGIKFNGDTAAANALDDYEEGTWTPGITGMTFSDTGGAYTKIGRRVQCSGYIINCTSGTASAVGAFLSGLPFTVSNTLSTTSLEDGGVMHYYNNFGRSTSCITIAPDDSSTECFLYFTAGASTGLTSVLRTDVDNPSFSCRFFFTYIST